MDVDDNPAVPGRYAIVGIPTLMLFLGGQVVGALSAHFKERILAPGAATRKGRGLIRPN